MAHTATSALSYLDAAHVNCPAGVLSELQVVTADGEKVGHVAGVVIEAAARRARYLDVRSSGWLRRRHYLVEADQLAQVNLEQKQLRLLSGDIREIQGLDPSTLRQFSDDDLLQALFRSRAA